MVFVGAVFEISPFSLVFHGEGLELVQRREGCYLYRR